MLGQIKEVAKKSRACLPYSLVFTLIFSEFKVNCDGEDAKKLLHIDRYNEWSLHCMGYRKVDDRWIHIASDRELLLQILILMVVVKMMMLIMRMIL